MYLEIINKISQRFIFVGLGKVLSLISLPIITRALGPENYGIYTLAFIIAGYAYLPSNWGFLAKGIREVASTDSKKERSDIVSNLISTRITLLLICTPFILIITYLIFGDLKYLLLVSIALFKFLCMCSVIDYFYYGKGDVLTPSLAHFLGQLVYIILIVMFINEENDIYLAAALLSVTYITESLILIKYYRENYFLNFSLKVKKSIIEFRNNFKLGMGLKYEFIQSSYPILIISVLGTEETLGNFASSYKLYFIVTLFMSTVILSISPYIVRSRYMLDNEANKLLLIYTLCSLVLGVIISLFIGHYSQYISNILFGKDYIEAGKYIKLLSYYVISITPVYLSLISIINNYSMDEYFLKGSLIQLVFFLIAAPIMYLRYDVNGLIYIIAAVLYIGIAFYTYIIITYRDSV